MDANYNAKTFDNFTTSHNTPPRMTNRSSFRSSDEYPRSHEGKKPLKNLSHFGKIQKKDSENYLKVPAFDLVKELSVEQADSSKVNENFTV